MKVLLLLLCIVSAFSSYAQDLLIKTDGTTIPYKKLKWDEGIGTVTTDKNQKITIREVEVFGIYEEFNQRVSYKKPNIPLNENGQGKQKEGNGFQYLQKEETGTINLYKEEIISSYRGASGTNHTSSTIYYYAEKGNEFKNIMTTGTFYKEDALNVFKSFFTDDREVLDEIESGEFVYNIKNLLKVVRKYNMSHFEKPSAPDYQVIGTIGFFTKAEGKSKASIVLKVNDSIEYKLPASHHPLPIKVPLNKPSKVCATWDGGSACELVEPIRYATTYYEVEINLNKTLALEKQTYSQFRSYISKAIQSD